MKMVPGVGLGLSGNILFPAVTHCDIILSTLRKVLLWHSCSCSTGFYSRLTAWLTAAKVNHTLGTRATTGTPIQTPPKPKTNHRGTGNC